MYFPLLTPFQMLVKKKRSLTVGSHKHITNISSPSQCLVPDSLFKANPVLSCQCVLVSKYRAITCIEQGGVYAANTM